VVAALEVNAFHVPALSFREGGGGRGVYPLAALMNHSCEANARYTIYPDKHWLCEVRAAVAIDGGQEICDSYVDPILAGAARRRKLRQGWFFDCRCSRCRRESEEKDENEEDTDEVDVDEVDVGHLPSMLDTANAKTSKSLRIKRRLIFSSSLGVDERMAYCIDLLAAYDLAAPGLTQERGLALAVLVATAQRALPKDEKAALPFVGEMLTLAAEAGDCLRHEPVGSQGHTAHKVVLMAQERFKELHLLLTAVIKSNS